jgi:hypothetical protein
MGLLPLEMPQQAQAPQLGLELALDLVQELVPELAIFREQIVALTKKTNRC